MLPLTVILLVTVCWNILWQVPLSNSRVQKEITSRIMQSYDSRHTAFTWDFWKWTQAPPGKIASPPPPLPPRRHPRCLCPFHIPFLRSCKGLQQLAVCIYLVIICLIEKLKLNYSEVSPPTRTFAFYASFYKEGDEWWFTLLKAILKGNIWRRSICRAGGGCTSLAY